jgi:hypothetical protein
MLRPHSKKMYTKFSKLQKGNKKCNNFNRTSLEMRHSTDDVRVTTLALLTSLVASLFHYYQYFAFGLLTLLLFPQPLFRQLFVTDKKSQRKYVHNNNHNF